MRRAAILMIALLVSAEAGGQPVTPAPQPSPAAEAAPSPPQTPPSAESYAASICRLIESSARDNSLPPDFFNQLIWQESRFKPDAVGPVTRSGRRAEGIAQFMPLTAAERYLVDPFDPAQALPKSAEFLRDLHRQFGNLGLAAMAYNAGPQRVRDWLDGKRTLPNETRNYVRKITGHAAELWAGPQGPLLNAVPPALTSCGQMARGIARPPAPVKVAADPATAAAPPAPWSVQLIGDHSEANARSAYRRLQGKHKAVLEGFEPTVLRTTTPRGLVVWTRIRIDFATRQTADLLCGKLRTAGENCLVQRN